MPIFRDLEKKLEGIFEDLFGRAFRSGVQPIEIARKLIREMDDSKRIGISSVYVANRYTVFLGKEDKEKLAAFEAPVIDEVEDYLIKHSTKAGYSLFSRPKVTIELDEELKLGEFGISSHYEEEGQEEIASESMRMRTMIYRPGNDKPDLRVSETSMPRSFLISKSIPGGEYALEKNVITLGRSKKNDLDISDSKVSREHAEVIQDESGRVLVVDLESTNGTYLNGKKIKKAILNDGDVIALGMTEILFKRRK